MKHIQVPKVFFTNEKYKKLSNDAKIGWAILLDRHNLSESNDWIEEETGRIYFVFKQEEIMKLLNISSKSTWQKVKKELENADLLESKRMGLKQANRLYIKWPDVTDEDVYKIRESEKEPVKPTPATEVQKMDFKKYNNRTSRSTENVPQEVQKLYSNNTYLNNTDLNNTEKNNHHPIIENFNQHQSNLLHEVIKEEKIDDDLQGKLFNRLQGRDFSTKAYILKSLNTAKNEVSAAYSSVPISRVKIPTWLRSQPNFDDIDPDELLPPSTPTDNLQYHLDKLEDSLNAGTITQEQYEESKDFYMSLYETDDSDEKRAW